MSLRSVLYDLAVESPIAAGVDMRGSSPLHRIRGSNVATRTADVLEHAESVFDNEQDAVEWLSTPNPSLSGRAPLSLLDTDTGAREVDDLLTRLEFGVYG